MASIIRRRGSSIWTAFFRDSTGRARCHLKNRTASTTLSGVELDRLRSCEAIVEKGLRTFVEVGTALAEFERAPQRVRQGIAQNVDSELHN
jgi:hypothetical protein